MASSKDYLNYVLEQLNELEGLAYRPMMGEYILYYRNIVVGGVYDDRLLLKPTKSAKTLMPDARFELPYQGAKEMLLADVDDRSVVCRAIVSIADDLTSMQKGKKDV